MCVARNKKKTTHLYVESRMQRYVRECSDRKFCAYKLAQIFSFGRVVFACVCVRAFLFVANTNPRITYSCIHLIVIPHSLQKAGHSLSLTAHKTPPNRTPIHPEPSFKLVTPAELRVRIGRFFWPSHAHICRGLKKTKSPLNSSFDVRYNIRRTASRAARHVRTAESFRITVTGCRPRGLGRRLVGLNVWCVCKFVQCTRQCRF